MLYWLQVSLQLDCKNLGSGIPTLMAADKPCPQLKPSLCVISLFLDTLYLLRPTDFLLWMFSSKKETNDGLHVPRAKQFGMSPHTLDHYGAVSMESVSYIHQPKLHIPSTIHIWKKLLSTAIWSDKNGLVLQNILHFK